ncbi:hypothetical protein GE107_07005 [Cohnella sp. CFH 77786]|uniref:hypothetical protein n=1 Tax=Cohnella sp. CFH 77786 TaxID=2662265 RepID=UPI001C60DFB1|nr:hypothetical protein [Cohnella sp. CFH 77786]MBW5445809.1 hypothetical protein [Cohnella sp. CFH 77786]
MKPELHLFIVWEQAAPMMQPIMQDILTKFKVKKAYQIYWTPSLFSSNLSRFYSQDLPPCSEKEMHCGRGPFFCIIVLDERPAYGPRQTSKGVLTVNTNVFDSKSLYRQWTGGGHKIHATNTPAECSRDLNLLLGYDPDTFLLNHPMNWDGQCPVLHQDLRGTHGWEDLRQLFSVLNATTDYVVLRNFEHLPNIYSTELHGDIDLLVRDPVDVAYLLNGQKVFPEPYRIHYRVPVGGQSVLFDFRHVGDGYMDENWEMSIMQNKTYSSKGLFTPNPRDYFYSLLYHAAIHKPFIAPDYFERLSMMAKQMEIADFTPDTMTDPRLLKSFLDAYLNSRNYQYTVPLDLSVFFNRSLLDRS